MLATSGGMVSTYNFSNIKTSSTILIFGHIYIFVFSLTKPFFQVAGQYLPVMDPRIFGREEIRQPVVMGPGMMQPVSMGPEMMQPGSMGPRVMQPTFMGPRMEPNIQMSPGVSSPITLTHGQNIRSSYYGPEIITPSRQL